MKNNRSLFKYEEEEVVPNAWSSDLPSDLLGLISDKLRSMPLSAFIKFGSVCFQWRSFCIQNYQHIKLPSKLPGLLLPISSPPICGTPTTTTTTVNRKFYYDIEDDHEEEEEEVQDDDEEEDDIEDDHEEEEEDDNDVEDDHQEEEEEVQDDDEEEDDIEDDHEEEEEEDDNDVEDDHQEEEEEVQDDDEEEDEEDDEADLLPANYYNPRDIWDGQDSKQRFKNTRVLYNISEKIVYQDYPLQIPYYKNVRGSSHGWLVTVEEGWTDKGVKYNRVQLFNPFRTDNNKINLPPFPSLSTRKAHLKNCPSNYLHRTCLSTNPSSLSDLTELVVLGVCVRSKVWFCRPGDKDWTHLEDMYEKVQDMLCYEGHLFYAILQSGYVFAFVIDAAQHHPKHTYTIGISPPQQDGLYTFQAYTLRYLVVCNGDLLQIRREIMVNLGSYQTCQFRIFKLGPMRDQWDEIKTLNDHMLFLGGSSTSMSLCALDFPGCKPNSIYYTDNFEIYYVTQLLTGPRGPHDIGVYNVEDGSFERYYDMESKVIMPAPVWIQPML